MSTPISHPPEQEIMSQQALEYGDSADAQVHGILKRQEPTPYLFACLLAASYAIGHSLGKDFGLGEEGNQELRSTVTEAVATEIMRGIVERRQQDRYSWTRAPWSEGLQQ